MAASDIVISGAREHNLRSVSVSLPRHRLICFTGVSGSGKSSLAFDTLYAEGQRRYVESLSSFARQFLGQMPKPEVDHISGLSPSISISQKTSGQNPRSTVGTITEIYDYLRVLFARVGQGHCPRCGQLITAQSREQIVDRLLALDRGTRFLVLAPLIKGQKGEYRDLFVDLMKQGFARARVDGRVVSLSDDLRLDRQMRHTIEVVVDRLVAGSVNRVRAAEAVELALAQGKGHVILAPESAEGEAPDDLEGAAPASADLRLSADYACTQCGVGFEGPSPQLFSFNSPQGMCPGCDGLGEMYSFDAAALIPNSALSLKDGAFELLGAWKDLGRWRKHIYDGVAETVERTESLPAGTMLDTPWKKLPARLQKMWLWGTGDLHVTYSWRHGGGLYKYGGKFEGLIPELLSKYRQSKSGMQRRQLEKYMRVVTCGQCNGERLNPQARAVRITTGHRQFAEHPSRTLPEVCRLSVADAARYFEELQLDDVGQRIAGEVLKEVRGRLGFLLNVGLDYLSLDRTAPTLSGGESQRIRLAGQIGCGLVGVLYILDEPSIGLHPRDNTRLLSTLEQLRDLGNTVVVVEHDEDTIRAADHVIDFGPGPGVHGGEIVAAGRVDEVCREPKSVTGAFLSGQRKIEIPSRRRAPGEARLRVVGATHNNLKHVDVEIPLGLFVCVTGVSGSGKSSLVNDVLLEALHRDLNRGEGQPGAHERIEGLEHVDKLIAIDQSPIGRTPRSNPGTYIKVFDDIRHLFTQTHDAKSRGYKPGRFSFNVPGGRCEACEGNGSNKLEMDFLADLWVTCPVCQGRRFNRETLDIRFKNLSISDVLEMSIESALKHFENIPAIHDKLRTLHDVGLDYLRIGQPSPTLSGGEAQRIKLARELVKRSTGRTIYLLDEPTTGLHFADIAMLLAVLQKLVEAGNTVLVVEHNLDVIKTADWVIDLGPEGGPDGGQVIAVGTPEQIAAHPGSHTGRSLADVLAAPRPASARPANSKRIPKRAAPHDPSLKQIRVEGARQHNLKDVNVEIPRDKMTVCCGPSGSGKSSLAMDTIYAEGQRRYVESLSSYARQFVGQMQKPQLDHISGLSPAIAIEQKNLGHTPRSTVGTVTEIYDYLRILFARLGTPYCPDCDQPIGTQTADEITAKLAAHPAGTKLYLLAPLEVAVGEKFEELWEELRASGYARVRIDGATHALDAAPTIDRRRKHAVEVVVDRVTIGPQSRSRLAGSVETALSLGHGVMRVAYVDDATPEARWTVATHSQHFACDRCGRSFERLTPHNFSFNSSLGWCPACEGLGVQTGANPAALLRDPKLSLAEGAIAIWPQADQPLFRAMLEALAAQFGIPSDRPFDQLTAKQRRMILQGTGDEWIELKRPARGAEGNGSAAGATALRFQYKGLYPALEEASRLSAGFRARLDHLVGDVECSTCSGSRLRDDASAVQFRGLTIDELCRQPLADVMRAVDSWKLTGDDRKIAGELIREIRNRLEFLLDVGLDYLALGRPAPTLSGGEAQRIRLASQLGSGLTGVLYVLDEPTIGLHPRDNRRLLGALQKLRDLGNTLLVVEHDREVVEAADQLLDFGPQAGEHGGEIVARGAPERVSKQRGSVTGPYLSGRKQIAIPSNRRTVDDATPALIIRGARHHNLQNVDVSIPLGTLTAVTGVSGSGKSSLVEDVLYAALARLLHRATLAPGAFEGLIGVDQINKVIRVDQQPLGNTPTSNPATYTGVFEQIRELFAQLPEAKLRGFSARRFSFNVPGGRCEKCEGNGQLRIEMHFLPDVWVPCDVCGGQRYNPETLGVRYKNHSIADVLTMPCHRARELFANIPKIRRILDTLCDVGLGYLTLGQSAPTLSGGEAQRVKLAAELARPDTGRTLYLLDEPTTGLHFDDLAKLLEVLQRLVDLGNTVLVIEHNLDVIKCADWVIDLGPEAGDRGGSVVVAGTPEQVVAHAERQQRGGRGAAGLLRSHTGEALADALARGKYAKRDRYDPEKALARRTDDLEIADVGRETTMPWQENGRRWHTQDRTARDGSPCRWEGRILAEIVDRIQAAGGFAPTNWNARSVVEITGPTKSAGWFLHAITGEAWLLKLKFRVARKTFQREALVAALALKPLNELAELPVYGNEPRVKCKNLRGPWQEVELRVYSWAEVDRPAFWKFLDEAIAAFDKHTARVAEEPDITKPWKLLGRKWHLARRGFPPGKKIAWPTEMLEELFELLGDVAPRGELLWNNQQVVHLRVPEQEEPWATVFTKRLASVDLTLIGPKNRFALGRVANLAGSRELQTHFPGRDYVILKFATSEDLYRGDLKAFLQEHLAAVSEAKQAKPLRSRASATAGASR